MSVCIFCLKHPSDTSPWCAGNPGEGCQYGMHHEYPDGEYAKAKPKQQPKKPDSKLCTKCGLHPKNPLSQSNGCSHDYPE